MRIVSIDGLSARCEARGIQREVSLFLLQDEPPRVGDHVLVHVGYAIQVIPGQQARSSWALLDEIVAGEQASDA